MEEAVMSENRDRAVDMRIEALRAAVAVATTSESIGNVLIHAGWVCQFLESGRPPEVESAVAGSIVAVNQV
jgi:hypothetical protein